MAHMSTYLIQNIYFYELKQISMFVSFCFAGNKRLKQRKTTTQMYLSLRCSWRVCAVGAWTNQLFSPRWTLQSMSTKCNLFKFSTRRGEKIRKMDYLQHWQGKYTTLTRKIEFNVAILMNWRKSTFLDRSISKENVCSRPEQTYSLFDQKK